CSNSRDPLLVSGAVVKKVGVGIVFGLMFLALGSTTFGWQSSRWEKRRAQVPPEDQQATILLDGTKRTYLLHVPSILPDERPVPLVLVFHGCGGHARNMRNFTQFYRLADTEQFVVAYPKSFNKSWNDTRADCHPPPTLHAFVH